MSKLGSARAEQNQEERSSESKKGNKHVEVEIFVEKTVEGQIQK